MQSLQGHLLIASPKLLDPNFVRSVVLIIQHDEAGAMGLIVNRPTDTAVSEAWEQISGKPSVRQDALYVGGPCQTLLMAVHTQAEASQIQIIPGIHFSSESDHITSLMERTDAFVKFFVGYAGWSAGQLEEELASGSWLTTPATFEHVFQGAEDQWEELVKQIARSLAYPSLNPKIIPIDPSMN